MANIPTMSSDASPSLSAREQLADREGTEMPPRLLIVDDIQAIRDVVTTVATAAGMEVCGTAGDGQ